MRRPVGIGRRDFFVCVAGGGEMASGLPTACAWGGMCGCLGSLDGMRPSETGGSTMPLWRVGMRTEPPISLLCAIGPIPTATAAPAPALDPPARDRPRPRRPGFGGQHAHIWVDRRVHGTKAGHARFHCLPA